MSTTTTYLEMTDQDTGENNNTWGDVADANMAILEKAICLGENFAVTAADVTLTAAQNRNAILTTSGVLTGNRNLIVKTQMKWWWVYNGCTGAFTLTVKTVAGTGIVVPQGTFAALRCDGTNVVKMDLARKGDIKIWSGATTDIESGWQLCDGTNGTPNLRDKFLVGAGTTYAVAATGGATSVTS